MPTLDEYRAQYPQYADVPDDAFMRGLYKKHGEGTPREEFDRMTGFKSAPAAATEAVPSEEDYGGTKLPEGAGWMDAASLAVDNAVPSAIKFGHDLVAPLSDPVGTAKSIGKVGVGAFQKLTPGEGEYEKYADAVGQFYKDRYGSMEGFKKAFAEDPVGVAADMSMFLTGGGSAVARAPGMIGKAGRIAKTAGDVIDPIQNIGRAVKGTGKGAAWTAGLTTGTGMTPIETAAKAGYTGGDAAKAFKENYLGEADIAAPVADAKTALAKIRENRSLQYRVNKAGWAANLNPLDFAAVDKAWARAQGVKSFKGKELDPDSAAIRQKINDAFDEWRGLDPKEFHTAEGFDALKQKIGAIRQRTDFGSPDRLIADTAYNAVKKEIVRQDPKYAESMKAYETANKMIGEIERSFSLGEKRSLDTALRKLQSVMRNNVYTNWGQRTALVDELKKAGAEHILEKLAGQSLNTWEPRGLARIVGGGQAAAGSAGIGASLMGMVDPSTLAIMAPSLASQSPKIMGGLAYGAGVATRPAKAITAANNVLRSVGISPSVVPMSAYQAGRLQPLLDDEEELP